MTVDGYCAVFLLGLTAFASSEVRSLNGLHWTVTNSNKSISLNASVPGGIYTDLINGGVIKDYIFAKMNDMKYRWVGRENWTYAASFDLSANDLKSNVRLVFHGLDTVASIWLNGKSVGVSTNMFVRTVHHIKHAVHAGTNNLEVRFKSPITSGELLAESVGYKIPPICPSTTYHGECNVNQLRKMQASFSWDWGPAFPSVGIWKPVEIELMKPNRMRNVGFKTFDIDTDVNNYLVEVTVWFDELKAEGHLSIEVDIQKANVVYKSLISLTNGQFKANLMLPKRYTQLWWPRGYGNPHLYKMVVKFSSQGTDQQKVIHVGVRTVEIKQQPIVAGQEQKGFTFYLMVNKVPVFVKGSNWIPMDVLPERGSDPKRLTHLLQSACHANFNALRVWGGGVYESDLFYELCDRYGLLVWQDLMFACAMYPATEQFLNSVHLELNQQIKRLHYHPSIFAYGGNNENEAALVQNWYGTESNATLYRDDYLTLYIQTVKPAVESLDTSRPFFSSSPSNGLDTVRQGYVAKNPQNPSFGDVHFYIYFGNLWDPNIFPVPRFASEYGMQSYPSFHTLSKVLDSEELIWTSEAMEWRQHLPMGSIYMEFQVKTNLPWSSKVEDIVYLSQINQAMAMKTETEHYRTYKTIVDDAYQGRTMGALYWQLNDVWEAPTWSSIDYEGNWKMLHYFARDFFADLIVVPIKKLSNLEVYVVSDANIRTYPRPMTVQVVTHKWTWTSFKPISSSLNTMDILPGDSQLLYSSPLTSLLGECKLEDCFLTFELTGSPGAVFFPKSLKSSNFTDSTVKITKATIVDKESTTVALQLEASSVALFVWLESPLQNIDTSFSDNGFHMFSPTKTVKVVVRTGITQQFIDSIQVRNLKKSYI